MRRSSTRWSAVKAMVWKEGREKFLWAFAAVLVMALLISVAIYSDVDSTTRDYKDYRGLWDFAQTVVCCTVNLLAFFLGWNQMSGEGKRDAWAFLVHRPATRRFLFWSKAVAGLGLCALVIVAVYGSFAVGMRFVNAPMPWSWRMLWFGVVVWLLCAVTYFAGALLSLRKRPWVGSRLLPVCPAFVAIMILVNQQWPGTWTQFLSFGLLVSIVWMLAWAAQGCFENGLLRHRSRATQIALCGVLAVGFGSLFLIVTNLAGGFEQYLNRKTPQIASANYSDYYLVPDGRVLHFQQGLNGRLSSARLSELNGKVVAQGKQLRDKKLRLQPFLGLMPLSFEDAPFPGSYASHYTPLGSSGQRNSDQVTMWWFDNAQRRIVGYDFKTGNLSGYIGINGLAQNSNAVVPFDEQPKFQANPDENRVLSHLLIFPHSVYRLDLASQNVRLVLRTPEEIEGVSSIYTAFFNPAINGESPVVVTKNTMTIFDKSSTRSPLMIPIPDIPYRIVEMARLPDGRFWLKFKSAGDDNTPVKVMALSPDGKIQQTMTLPPLSQLTQSQMPVTARVAIALMPAALSHWNVSEMRSFMGLSIGSREATEGVWISILLSAFSAFFAWRRANRYAFKSSTRLWWTIGVFAVGPLGYFLMRSLLDWSALEKCPSCGKLRVVDRELCEHCSSPFAPPLLDGTEIIEDAAPEISALRLAS